MRINFFWFAYNARSPREHFEQYWNMLKEELPDVQYRCHWGKEMPYGERQPNWDDDFRGNIKKFLEIRKALDPDELFYTDYWKRVLTGVPGAS